MSQETIVEFLKEHKGDWFTAAQISVKIGISRGAAIKSLRSLRKGNEVVYKQVFNHGIYSMMYSIPKGARINIF